MWRNAEQHVNIREAKNLVPLTKPALGKKFQATFLHSVVEIPMIPDSVHYVARTGMKFSLWIELRPDSLFYQTVYRHVPSVVELLKLVTEKDYMDLKALTMGSKKKLNCFAVLTLSLVEVVQSTDMNPV